MVQGEIRVSQQSTFEQEVESFIREWHSKSEYVTVHTSGSTGTPKEMRVKKKRMENSARLTCSFLGLKSGDTALLCMPLCYIAGKMVVVRSIVAALKLWVVAPSNHPLQELNEAPFFAAMIPMQVYSSLQVPAEATLLKQIRQLIIGGGAIDKELEANLQNFPNPVWSTYGMTETLSHIALRRLNGPEASLWYTPFDSVQIRITDEGTLAIYAPLVCEEELITNDIAKINEQGQFRIIGRKDNTINSGGIKMQIEEIEERLVKRLSLPYQITSVPDAKFGDAVVLLIAKDETISAIEKKALVTEIESLCAKHLDKYQCPKHIFIVSRLPVTETGKPNRAEAKVMAKKFL